MNPTGKKFIVMFFIFSILLLSVNLYARKPGAKLRIVKLNGQVVEGELLTVKQDSLLLMTSPSQTGVYIEINDIITIEIKRDSGEARFWKGTLPGAIVTGSVGFGLGYLVSSIEGEGYAFQDGMRSGYVCAIPGALLGGLIALIPGDYKTVQIQGKSSAKIEKILKKLKKKAGFKTEIPKDFSQVLVPPKISRFHLTVDHGYFNSQAFDYKRWFGNVGLGGDETLTGPTGGLINDQFPYIKNLKIEYSINKKFALGFIFSPFKEYKLDGTIGARCLVDYPPFWENEYDNFGCCLLGDHKCNVYYFTAAYMPLPETFYKKSSFKIGTGVGLSVVDLNFRTNHHGFSGYPEIEFDSISSSRKSLCFCAFGEYDFYFNRNLSVGINVDYKYIPVRIDAFQLSASYGCFVSDEYVQFHSSVLDFPQYTVNFGGYGIGINFGFHF